MGIFVFRMNKAQRAALKRGIRASKNKSYARRLDRAAARYYKKRHGK